MDTTTRKMTENPVVRRIVRLVKEKGKRPDGSSWTITGCHVEMEVRWKLCLYKIYRKNM